MSEKSAIKISVTALQSDQEQLGLLRELSALLQLCELDRQVGIWMQGPVGHLSVQLASEPKHWVNAHPDAVEDFQERLTEILRSGFPHAKYSAQNHSELLTF